MVNHDKAPEYQPEDREAFMPVPTQESVTIPHTTHEYPETWQERAALELPNTFED